MRHRIEIENIEEMRRQEGIEDLELREEIRGLKVGDFVKLTVFNTTKPTGAETVLIRITSRRDSAFRGKLVTQPTSGGLSELRAGALLVFTAAHIHSVSKSQLANGT